MQTTTTRIDSEWQVSAAHPSEASPGLQLPPLPADVPGCIHLDLHRAGVIPDPFYRLHERDVAWVDDEDWCYQTSFHLDSVPDGDVYLRFLGLDTIAEINLNGEVLGETDNMFLTHEFPVRSLLKAGENTLTVTFRSARRVGRERLASWSAQHDAPPRHHMLWDARSFVRKAQYMFGWDWGPILISCGIWRPIELVSVPSARLSDWRYDVTFEGDRAEVRIEAAVDRASTAPDTPLTLEVAVGDADRATVDVPRGTGRVEVSTTVQVAEARRWSPTDPHLYPVTIRVRSGDTLADERTARVGLRTVELVRQEDPDGEGQGFLFRINGVDHFCKGANWIPADSFPVRSFDVEARLRPLVSAAKEAGFTMLRVWGGGMYESETFYDLCDELGILVWQDFPYACAYYPDDDDALRVARTEATVAVRRIRVHPSLALWCGNNENDQMYFDDWNGLRPPHYLGEAIYRTVLPEVVEAEDPSTPYWPSSAFGGENPNSEDYGDRHNWDVWHAHGASDGDWRYYAQDRARFCSEFGFASSCGTAAWDTCLAPADRSPRSPAVRWHDKTGKDYEVYIGYVEKHFPTVRSLDDLVYYSQLNQAEAMAFGVEHYRRLKGRCWGTLIWQLNDCWPVQSWAMIDYAGEPKAAYYASRRFYAPVMVSVKNQGSRVDVHVTNDLLTPISGHLFVEIAGFNGQTVHTENASVSLDANATGRVASVDVHGLQLDPRDVYVHASLDLEGASAPAETIAFLAEPRDLRLPEPQVRVTIDDTGGGPVAQVEAEQFAAYVRLSSPALEPLAFADNYFHLRPGEQRTVSVTGSGDLDSAKLRETLQIRTLNAST